MAKLELVKSIDAAKLNRRSRLPVHEPPATIPYGAIVQDVEEDGLNVRFSYLGDLYQCPLEQLRDAAAAPAAAPAASAGAAPAPEVDIQWQSLRSSLGSMWRAAVPGGWLVAMGPGEARSLVFYSDARHEWDGRSLRPA